MAFSEKAQKIINDFSKQNGVTEEHVNNLKDAILSSPVLNEQFNYVANRGLLRGLQALPPNSGMGGKFNGQNKVISISLDQFSSANYQQEKGDNVFVLGHEIRHAYNDRAMGKARYDYNQELQQEVSKPSPRDYTQEVRKMMAAHKWDEATAEIAGYNAVVSMVKESSRNKGVTVTLMDIYQAAEYRMDDFINNTKTGYVIKSNLALNADLTLSYNSRNIQGMETNYFDNPDITVGKGNVNYNHYYAASEISTAMRYEQNEHGKEHNPDPFRIDLKALGLDEPRLERAGIRLNNPSDRIPYYDLGREQNGLFDHTYETHQHVPAEQAKPVDDWGNKTLGSQTVDISQPLAKNASIQDFNNYGFAALLSDNDDSRFAALDSIMASNVGQDAERQSREAVQAHDLEQERIQEMNTLTIKR